MSSLLFLLMVALTATAVAAEELKLSKNGEEFTVKSEEVETFLKLLRAQTRAAPSGCSCSAANKSCTCCVSLNVPLLLHAHVCVVLARDPKETTFNMTVKYNERVIDSRVIDGRNPPIMSISIPEVKLAKLGIQLYDIPWGTGKFNGCVHLHAKVLGKVLASLRIGCFTLSPLELPVKPGNPPKPEDKLEMRAEDLQTLFQLIKQESSFAATGCSCSSSSKSCSCCVAINIPVIGRAEVCVDVAYDPKKIGVKLTLRYNNKVIYTTTVSASDPPAICVGVPGVGGVKLCIKLSDLTWQNKFSGCVSLQAKLMGATVLNIKLGCFNKGG